MYGDWERKVTTQDELIDAILEEHETLYIQTGKWEALHKHALQQYPQNLIYASEVQDWIQRYAYCDQYPSVPPFPGGFDSQPAWWIEVSQVIQSQRIAAQEYNNGT